MYLETIIREDVIQTFIDWELKEFGYHDLNRSERFIDALKALPSADRPSIVRCGECKHRYYADNRVPHEKTWVCERFMNEEITSNDFCSWGERKGGDTE